MNLREFGDWALATGSVANPDGSYLGECVSLIQQYYYKVFGIPFQGRGNAKDICYNIPNGFTWVSGSLQAGDILVYGGNYPQSNGYGHCGIIDINYNFLEQNGAKYHAVTYRSTIPQGYIAILRPNDQSKIGAKKDFNQIAREVIAGNWGNGEDRKNALRKAGYSDNEICEIQAMVNSILNSNGSNKTIDQVAREVIAGQWGNGSERYTRLTNAGYNYDEVQNRVNQILG